MGGFRGGAPEIFFRLTFPCYQMMKYAWFCYKTWKKISGVNPGTLFITHMFSGIFMEASGLEPSNFFGHFFVTKWSKMHEFATKIEKNFSGLTSKPLSSCLCTQECAAPLCSSCFVFLAVGIGKWFAKQELSWLLQEYRYAYFTYLTIGKDMLSQKCLKSSLTLENHEG